MRRIFMHIGLSKSGTTYLQQALWDSRDALAEHGVLYPGDAPTSQRHAAWDLLGRRLRGADAPYLPGCWQQLVELVSAWPGDRVIVSEEFLVHARPRHVRRVHRDLSGLEMHVVLTVRDLERTVRSMWVQELAMGNTWTFREYVDAVRDPGTGSTRAGVRFWLRFDVERILRTWELIVPAEHVHVVVVPPAGTPPELLGVRFADVTGLDPAVLRLPTGPVNPSMGAAEAEVLRRVNVQLGGRLSDNGYYFLVDRVIRPSFAGDGAVKLPDDDRRWIIERARAQADALRDGGYHVVGDPADLIPRESGFAGDQPPPVGEAAVADAAVGALTATMVHYARYRSRQVSPLRAEVPVSARLASSARALAFGSRLAVMNAADRNRLASMAAVRYLRRSSRRP